MVPLWHSSVIYIQCYHRGQILGMAGTFLMRNIMMWQDISSCVLLICNSLAKFFLAVIIFDLPPQLRWHWKAYEQPDTMVSGMWKQPVMINELAFGRRMWTVAFSFTFWLLCNGEIEYKGEEPGMVPGEEDKQFVSSAVHHLSVTRSLESLL